MRSRLVMVVLASLLTAGCWDRVEINDFAFALGTAVDKEDDLYRVSVQMALPGRLGTLGRGGGGTKAGEKN
ncbi:MAG TPA: Ger(x)C family spore germination protein, partial [Symbiobacteriaceae bacterium]|nr:Ger(x)C family spore germination protein [Symbiobacteriaceae bacterium]